MCFLVLLLGMPAKGNIITNVITFHLSPKAFILFSLIIRNYIEDITNNSRNIHNFLLNGTALPQLWIRLRIWVTNLGFNLKLAFVHPKTHAKWST